MKRGIWLWLTSLAFMSFAGGAWATNSLTIGSDTGTEATIPVTMSADDPVQGFVLAVACDGSWATVSDVTVAGTATSAAGADFVVPEIFAGGFTLGVVVDSTGQTGKTIPKGTNVIAKFTIEADKAPPCGDPPHEVALEFVDGVLNSPPLSNIIVIAGRSIGEGEGLDLNDGVFRIPGVCATVKVAPPACDGKAQILLENPEDVQGFVLSLENDPTVALSEITLAGTVTAAVGAEFMVPRIYADGGTLGVVLDFEPPYLGQTIPGGGAAKHIATFVYVAAQALPCESPSLRAGVRFVDGKFGSPPLDNVLVVAGLSETPDKVDGEVCTLPGPPCPGELDFYAGAQKPDGSVGCVVAAPGETAQVGFFYTSLPFGGLTGMIQGLSMAVVYPCDKLNPAGDFSIEGTISQALGAEFVTWHSKCKGVQGELVIGILLDSVPPFADQRYPITLDSKPLEVGRMPFAVAADAGCDVTYPIEFRDGITGAGTVPINNRASIDNRSVPAGLNGGCVFVTRKEGLFIRGDCNWDETVDIADPAATINALFVGEFVIPCKDACDSNDDGRVDLADSVMTLRYLFQFGLPTPAPGPLVAGPDPTKDKLDCKASEVCR